MTDRSRGVELLPVGHVMLAVNASDVDDGRNAALSYRLEALDGPPSSSDVVSIDRRSGVVTALAAFDFESRQTYSSRDHVTHRKQLTHERL